MSVFGKDEMQRIVDSLGRGKGTWQLGHAPPEAGSRNVAVLACGAPTVVRLDRGIVITLGLTKESLTTLRDLANELLKELP